MQVNYIANKAVSPSVPSCALTSAHFINKISSLIRFPVDYFYVPLESSVNSWRKDTSA